MARLPRLVLPGHPHLIVHRAQAGLSAFRDDADRIAYLDALRASARDAGVAVHAYALLPNEVRLLATPREAPGLAQMMQMIGRRYVRHYNAKHQRAGTPWEGRFRSVAIDAEAEFVACLRYIEGAGVDGHSGDAAGLHSSRCHHVGMRALPSLVEHRAFWALGNTPFEREAAYRALLDAGQGERDLARIEAALRSGRPLGGPQFAAQAGEISGRQFTARPRGRPRKAIPSI